MSKTTRLCVLAIGLMSLVGVLASSAGAVTWHNSGATAYTATAGPGTVSSTGAAANCASSTATGTVPLVVVGLTFVASGTVTFNGCSLSGITTGVTCSFTTTGTSQDGTGMSARTTGTTDVTCDAYQFGSRLCHAEGTVSGSYLNGTPSVSTLNTGGNVKSTNPASGSCPLGNGDLLHISGGTRTSTSANPPTITRTA